jgi:sugar diacid utilization regulator
MHLPTTVEAWGSSFGYRRPDDGRRACSAQGTAATNTVYFRLNRIKKLTGVDARTYAGTSLLLTALRLSEVHGNARRG